MNITVLGAGAWGTAIAINLALRHSVVLWGRKNSVIVDAGNTRQNKVGLPGFVLPDPLQLTADFEKAVAHASGEDGLAIIATSVAGLREVAGNLRNSGIANLIWLCKGFEENTGLMPSQVVSEVTANRLNTGVLSGPSFAQEVAAGLPCALTIASKSSALRQRVTDAINGGNMRIYSSDDVTGVEVGGAVKNILAIATGMSDGLALGMNARAALITRGLAEITRLGVALGGRLETFMGLTGMGDLILTCTGDLSRNRQVGLGLAKGKSLEAVIAELGHVAEGVRCAQTVRLLSARVGVEMPIANAVAGILFDKVSIKSTVSQLLSRHVRDETDVLYRRNH
ncbi:NAD(P)-dependent glycerol-3-phosphate dehydrogenase [Oxalobacter aliiformigenes]|uniref:NAD(P)H-dependent glycerol-3-phosphate dehydrogenase n=1 Tax=Oxalobacter aliiformigenes TaxID=2946593 RepID=UPI0022B0112A|nr:NAD(P)H-dependent glycerol-3-phosphate dehydrogenase [Oxalobacter aliiformigenes]MCZ4064311.1 NAD(P)-dependent glycerol-3-phosphate dehydrogenase [Oxalobacter aliiformigenes]WAV98854.1 NAD(P)-dependent glycerol-3-phosphate dehydrogenase [Oxalobacter aliiformigenes]